MATVVDHYRSQFETLERRRARPGPSWLAPLRRAAIARFAEAGFPTTRDEDWRYTNLAPLIATPFRPIDESAPGRLPAGTLERLAIGETHWPRLVFVDGRYSSADSVRPPLPGSARLLSLAEAMTADADLVQRHLARHAGSDANIFATLSTAFFEDGAFVHVPAETSLSSPIELLFVTRTPGVMVQPRVVVVADRGSRVRIVERYVGLTDEAYFANAVTEILVGDAALVDHYVLQEQGRGAFHVATIHAELQRDSALSTCSATFGGRLGRTTFGLRFNGQGAQGSIGGLYVLGDRQHVDHHITVDHAVPRCSSRQLFKGVLDGESRAVFNGRIIVRPGAQKTDANQTNKHLLLSDRVEVDSKPHLEIFADDVRCTHGAAEGQLAAEALFYLRSRGLDEARARALLTYGFAREVLDRIAVETIQAHLDRMLMARLLPSRAAKELS